MVSDGMGTVNGGVDTRGWPGWTFCPDNDDDDICLAGIFLKAGFRLSDFNESLVIVNVEDFLIELRAINLEVLLESINIFHISEEKGQPQRKYSASYCRSRPHSDFLFPDEQSPITM
jgi:hypothetical protein